MIVQNYNTNFTIQTTIVEQNFKSKVCLHPVKQVVTIATTDFRRTGSCHITEELRRVGIFHSNMIF